jgi:hypothetical protein
MTMNAATSALVLLLASTAFACGCGSGGDTNDGGAEGATSAGDSGHHGKPRDAGHDSARPGKDTGVEADHEAGRAGPPALGRQIDRMGRPAINTVLNHSFDPSPTTANSAKDAYNAASSPASWLTLAVGNGPITGKPTSVEQQLEANLAILDGLDGVCGNQLLADTTKTDATRYKRLADELGADMLWVNTAPAGGKPLACTRYLAVEANAAGLKNADCGGRGLAYDVVNITYNLIIDGKVAPTPVSDGTKAVAAKTDGTTFPYLGEPL